jgi:DNA-3-methyladenine glycosylase
LTAVLVAVAWHQALALDRSHDGLSLLEAGEVFLEHGEVVGSEEVVTGGRVGVDYSGEWARAPLRFAVRGSTHVSKPWPWK